MNSGSKFNLFLYTSAFGFLLIVATLGLLLRSTPFIDIPLPYQHLLHAHSHTALLGWAFVMSYTCMISLFHIQFKYIKEYGVGLILTIIGMLLSFLYQGYGAISIAFSTLYILITYIVLYNIYKRLPKSFAGKILKRSILWFYISTIGIWLLGPTVVMFGKGFWLYHSSIQFFLHFQINGWLLYAALGIILIVLYAFNDKGNNIPISSSRVLYALDLGLLLGLSPLIYWVAPNPILLLLNAASALLLLYSLGHIARVIWLYQKKHHVLAKFISILLVISIATHIITLLPGFVTDMETNRNLIIAYLHLIMLGIVSLSYVFYALHTNLLPNNSITKLGTFLWSMGFIVTEMLLMVQGLFKIYITNYLQLLWLFSAVILIGIILLFFQIIGHKKSCPNGQPLQS